MKKPNTLNAIFGGAILLFATSSYAASTWNFSSCNQQAASAGTFGNSWVCSGTNGGPSVTAYAWGAQTVNSITTFQTAYLSPQGSSGFGVASRNEGISVSSPNHAMDNDPVSTNVPDLIALNFASAVTLDKVTLGWNKTDADVTVMAYKGGDPTIKDKTALDLTTGGAGAGWALVQHVGDGAPDSATSSSSTDITRTVNAANESSSWWLISAYNPAYTNNVGQLDTVLDYVKLFSVASKDIPPPPGVPEPGSLALIGLALIGMLSRRNRQPA